MWKFVNKLTKQEKREGGGKNHGHNIQTGCEMKPLVIL